MTDAARIQAEMALLRARALRRLRVERGMTRRQAAARLGVDSSIMTRYENGERTPPPAAEIAAAFRVTVAEVLALCPRCGYDPPPGFQCLHCGTASDSDPATATARAEWGIRHWPGSERVWEYGHDERRARTEHRLTTGRGELVSRVTFRGPWRDVEARQ